MLWSCSKLKSKSLTKGTLFTASRKLLFGFCLKRHQTVYIFIKDHSWAVQVSNLTARLTSKLICVRARGGSTARTRFCTDAEDVHKGREQWRRGTAYTSFKYNFKIQTHYAACFSAFVLFAFYEGWVSFWLVCLLEFKQLIFPNKQTAWWIVTLLSLPWAQCFLKGTSTARWRLDVPIRIKYSINK